MISLIDSIQAQALAKTAREITTFEEREPCFQAWRAAIGNDPGNIELNRAYLESLLDLDVGKNHWRNGIQTARWLCKLTRTNLTDLTQLCRIYEFYEFPDLMIEAIDSYPGDIPLQIESSYNRALLLLGQFETYENATSTSENGETQTNSKQRFSGIHLSSSDMRKERSTNHVVTRNPTPTPQLTEEELDRKKLLNSCRLKNVVQARQAYKALTDQHCFPMNEFLVFADLLQELGYGDEAQHVLRAAPVRPRIPHEAVRIADTMTRLGMREEAIHFLGFHSADFGFNGSLWHSLANRLIVENRWEHLKSLARKIRNEEHTSNALMALSYYLEGKGEFEGGRFAAARQAFDKIQGFEMNESGLGLYVAVNLAQMGYNEAALAALLQETTNYRDRLSFWDLVFDVSNRLNDSSNMMIALQNCRRLEPRNTLYEFNYGSLLLSRREKPALALTIMFRALDRNPTNPVIQVNFAQALVLNERYDEARNVLELVQPSSLSLSDRQAYYAVYIELLHRLERYTEAEYWMNEIVPELLLPGDRKAFEALQLSSSESTPVTSP